jgi:hypothetical protein
MHEELQLELARNVQVSQLPTTDIDDLTLRSEQPRKEYRGIKAEGQARQHNGDIYSMSPVY